MVRKAQAAAWEDKFKAMKAKQKGSEVNTKTYNVESYSGCKRETKLTDFSTRVVFINQ